MQTNRSSQTHQTASISHNKNTKIIDLKYIIENKPSTSIVRKFMKENLDSIISEEQEIFDV